MGAGADLLAALQAGQYKASDSAYGIGAQGINAALPGLVDPYAGVGQNAAYIGGASILSALLTGMARNSAADDNAALAPIQQEFLNPATTEARKVELRKGPYGDRLSALANALLSNQTSNQLELQQAGKIKSQELALNQPYEVAKEHRGLFDDLQKQVASSEINLLGNQGKVPAPTLADPNAVREVYSPIKLAADKAKAEASAKILGDKEAQDILSSGTGARITSPKDQADLVAKYDTDLAGDPATRNYLEVNTQVGALKKALETNNPVDAKGALYLIAKSIDPSVVRGEELNFWKSTGSFGDRTEQMINDLEKGNLTPQLKEGLTHLADTLISARYDTYKTMADQRNGTLAGLIGSAPEKTGLNLLPFPASALSQAMNAKPSTADASSIPAGMKLQRNSMTGETRVVPQ